MFLLSEFILRKHSFTLPQMQTSEFISRRGFLKATGTAAINTGKKTIEDAPKNLINNTVQKAKGTIKNLNTVNSNLNELGQKGNNISSRRSFLKGAKNKVLIEAGKRPKQTNNVISNVAKTYGNAVKNINWMNGAEKINSGLKGLPKLLSKVM